MYFCKMFSNKSDTSYITPNSIVVLKCCPAAFKLILKEKLIKQVLLIEIILTYHYNYNYQLLY